MATRHERVVIDLEDRFTGPMARAAASSTMFRKSIDDSGRSVIAFDKTTKDLSPTIDRLSGRLALLTRAAAALGPGLVPITTAAVPAIAGLANQLAFAAAGAGTAVLALKGVGDALEALNAHQLEPTAESAAKLAEEMRGLGPAAQEFVRYLDQIGPQMQGIREAAQEGLLPGVQDSLEQMTNRLPQVRMIVSEIAEASGELMRATGTDLGSGRWNEFFAFLESEARPTLMVFGETVGHLASGMAELWMAFDPLSDDFSGGLLRMAEGFERWAAGLDQTQGFQEFLAYIRQTGPQVLDLLGSLVDMLVEVGTAMAPLGGPVLTILTKLADVIAAIASSDLGTPLLGAVAAMSALSLATRGFEATMGSKIPTAVRSVTTDLRTMGNVGIVAWGQSADEAKRYATAATGVKSSLAGFGKTAGLVAGLTIATSDLGQSMGVTNTASLALMGTMAGPWGAAIGAGAGLMLDLAAMNDELVDSLERTNATLREGTLPLADQAAALHAARDAVSEYRASLEEVNLFDPGVVKNTIESIFGKSDIEEAEAALALLEEQFARNYSEIQATDRALGSLSGVLDQNADGFVTSADAIMQNVEAMESLRDANLRAIDAEYAYAASLLDVQDRLKRRKELLAELKDAETVEDRKRIREELENYRLTLDKTTRAGQENWQALRNQAAAWNDLDPAAQNAKGAFKAAKDELYNTAIQFGATKAEARDYVKELLEIPPRRVTEVNIETGGALSAIAATRAALDSLRNKTVIVTTEQHTIARSPVAIARADGGSVPGQRHPYGDKVLAMLAPGEEVITNRNGQADRFRADRAAGRIPHYADGGTVRGYAKGGEVEYEPLTNRDFRQFNFSGTADIRREFEEFRRAVRDAGGEWTAQMQRAARQALATSRAYEKHANHLDKLTDRRGSLMSDVRDNFDNDPFGNGLSGAFLQLTADRNDSRKQTREMRRLRRLGLNGAAFQALAASGDLNTMSQIDTRGEVRRLEQLFAERARAQGTSAQFAGNSEFGKQIRVQNRLINRLENKLDRLEGAVERGARKGVGDRGQTTQQRRRAGR